MKTKKLRKLKMEAKNEIQNGRLNAGAEIQKCFHPSIPSILSILSTPKKLNKEKGK